VSPLRVNWTETVNMPALVRDVSQGPCVSQIVAGYCYQFHTIRYNLDPCSVRGVLAVNAGLQCSDPSVQDPSLCGFVAVAPDDKYLMRFLQVSYDSCPRSVAYGVSAKTPL
jgi:hypothetical protein